MQLICRVGYRLLAKVIRHSHTLNLVEHSFEECRAVVAVICEVSAAGTVADCLTKEGVAENLCTLDVLDFLHTIVA